MRQAYLHLFGKEPVLGQPVFHPDNIISGLLEQWMPRLEQVLKGQRLQFEEEYDLGACGSRWTSGSVPSWGKRAA